jgi:hypothetical protein
VKGLGPTPKRAYAVHGEAGLTAMASLLRDTGVPDVNVPALGDTFSF